MLLFRINRNNIIVLFFILNLLLSKNTIALTPGTKSFTTASGIPVSRYGLGGAARSTQPSSLPLTYFNEIQKQNKEEEDVAAPFYFYYNPHRYPNFMSGIQQITTTTTTSFGNREDMFIASGGTDRSIDGLNQRLSDCLDYCGGNYLDLFVLEYVCPDELDEITTMMKPGLELAAAFKYVRESWVENKKQTVRYIGISTHSHLVGKVLASCPEVDILMLRYGMSHKDAAEKLSLPAARKYKKPVIAFTTTRWNRLQQQEEEESQQDVPPTSADCLSFVFGTTPPVEAVLHSARNKEELLESFSGLRQLSKKEELKWRKYGTKFEELNDDDFDEYPEERV